MATVSASIDADAAASSRPPPLPSPPSLSAKSSDEDVAALAARLVPSWRKASLKPSSLAVKVISGGITNALWSVSIKGEEEEGHLDDKAACSSSSPNSTVLPRAVAVRAYGDRTDLLIDRDREVETLRRLNAEGFGASVVAAFGSGRVEELLPGRALTPEEAARAGVAERIARGLARLHAVGVVVEGGGGRRGAGKKKNTSCPFASSLLRHLRFKSRRRRRRRYEEKDSELFSTIREWISLADELDDEERAKEEEENGGKDGKEKKKKRAASSAVVDSGRLRAEVALLERSVAAACSPSSTSSSPELSRVVFCHMDLLPGNIMATTTEATTATTTTATATTAMTTASAGDESGGTEKEKKDEKTARGGGGGGGGGGPGSGLQFIDFEYGRPCFAAFDVGNHWCEYAGLECDWRKYPSGEQRASFARAYLDEARRKSSPSTTASAPASSPSSDAADIAAFVELGELFSLAAHLFWTSWAKVQVHVSPIDFDYGSYAASRFEEYLGRKGGVRLMMKE